MTDSLDTSAQQSCCLQMSGREAATIDALFLALRATRPGGHLCCLNLRFSQRAEIIEQVANIEGFKSRTLRPVVPRLLWDSAEARVEAEWLIDEESLSLIALVELVSITGVWEPKTAILAYPDQEYEVSYAWNQKAGFVVSGFGPRRK